MAMTIGGLAKAGAVGVETIRYYQRRGLLETPAGEGTTIATEVWALPAAGFGAFVAANLVNFLIINVFLAIFNLIPLPPFDGGHVVAGLLPESAADTPAPELRAEPAVAALAEQAFGGTPAIETAAQRLLHASRGAWDLAQFQFAQGGRARSRSVSAAPAVLMTCDAVTSSPLSRTRAAARPASSSGTARNGCCKPTGSRPTPTWSRRWSRKNPPPTRKNTRSRRAIRRRKPTLPEVT